MNDVILKMEQICKSFPGVKALDNCELELYRGEVHALLGENGAGKSTLMKILNGIYQADSGKIFIDGKQEEIHSVQDAKTFGISMIHQELNLLTNLTVAQNIFIGKEVMQKNKILLDEDAIVARTEELLNSVNLQVSPKTHVSALTIAQQQMVEIVKAISDNSKIVIMDEPTASLSAGEIERLFEIVRELQKKGCSIIYISHRMDEIKKICQRATIMRDGKYISTVDIASTPLEDIITQMVGRKIDYTRINRDSSAITDEKILEVQNLRYGKRVKNVSFTLYKGEILGVAGLVGAGRTEMSKAIFGAEKLKSGKIFVRGKEVKIASPYSAVRHGISYLSEDRKKYGLVTQMSIEDNILFPSMERFCSRFGIINKKKASETAVKYSELLKVKAPGVHAIVKSLSGGNQQKVIIAKWLLRNTDIFIFDEPTRGIDIGSKEEICNMLVELAKMGKSVIMISSEMQEILKVCDRIIVMCEGVVSGELDASTATQDQIMYLATSHKE